MNTQEILQLLQDVAEEVINPRFRSLSDDQVAEKNPGDLVTVADREAEVRITDALSHAYPGALILGEEANESDDTLLDRFRAADHAFTVDPVDGTKNFVSGSRDHAVMVAELRDGASCAAGSGSRSTARRTSPSGASAPGATVEPLVRPPAGDVLRGVTSRRRWIGRALDGLPPLELTWVCCGVDYPKLVEGAADYLIYSGTKPWDHAPGSLLLAESGAFLGTFEGQPYRPQDPAPSGLVGAADRATYDLVQDLVGDLP